MDVSTNLQNIFRRETFRRHCQSIVWLEMKNDAERVDEKVNEFLFDIIKSSSSRFTTLTWSYHLHGYGEIGLMKDLQVYCPMNVVVQDWKMEPKGNVDLKTKFDRYVRRSTWWTNGNGWDVVVEAFLLRIQNRIDGFQTIVTSNSIGRGENKSMKTIRASMWREEKKEGREKMKKKKTKKKKKKKKGLLLSERMRSMSLNEQRCVKYTHTHTTLSLILSLHTHTHIHTDR